MDAKHSKESVDPSNPTGGVETSLNVSDSEEELLFLEKNKNIVKSTTDDQQEQSTQRVQTSSRIDLVNAIIDEEDVDNDVVQGEARASGAQRSKSINTTYDTNKADKNSPKQNEDDGNDVQALVSDVLVQSLLSLEQKSESFSAESESQESQIGEVAKKDTSISVKRSHEPIGVTRSFSRQTKRIYSTSSFCKDAAGFLEEQTHDTSVVVKYASDDISSQRKQATTITNEDSIRNDKRTPHYDQYARSGNVPENKSEKIPRHVLPRTKSGTVDFIAKNKYMVSSNPDHLQQHRTSKKRPKTATKRIDKIENKDAKIRDNPSESNESKGSINNRENTKPKQGRSESLTPAAGEWAELNESQFTSFRKLFLRFDQSQSGGISAEELFAAIREFMPEEDVSFGIVQKVHAELDIKQTGEIEFDEFLFAMTNPKNYMKLINDDDRKQLTQEIELWEKFQEKKKKHRMAIRARKKENEQNTENGNGNNIFFTMLRTATKKESMREIRHFYLNKIKKLNDHVITDWSAGQRCIGLSDQGVLKRYEHIMRELNNKKSPFAKDKIYKKSPYAIPFYWGLSELKNAESKRKSLRGEKVYKRPRVTTEGEIEKQRRSEFEFGMRRVQSAKRRDEIKPEPELSDEKISSAAKKVKIQQIKRRRRLAPPVRSDVYRAYSAPPTDIKIATQDKRDVKKKARSAPPRRVKISEFVVTPKVVPLPRYEIKNNPSIFDYDHLEDIRKSAADILQEYYNKLKKVSAKNSKVVYKKLHVNQISPILQKQFKNSYLAYSGECEPFVVSPWIPYPVPISWNNEAPLAQSYRTRSAWI